MPTLHQPPRALRRRPLLCAAALLALWTTGCEPDPPGGPDARAFHDAHLTELDALEAAVNAAVREIPWLETHEPECDEPSGAPTDDPLADRVRTMRCTQQRLARLEERDVAISRMETEVLPPLLEAAGAMSLRLTYRRRGSDHIYHLGAVEPAPPAAREGAVRAKSGVRVDGHSLGWGLFASRWTDAEGVPHGDESFVRGYEIAWHLEVGDADIEASAFFLDPP